MWARIVVVVVLLTVASGTALAQPTLDQLWPHEDGKTWSYNGVMEELGFAATSFSGRLVFQGFATMPPGVEVQNLVGLDNGVTTSIQEDLPAGLSPLMRRLWIARPGLRDAIIQRADKHRFFYWPALLMAPAELELGVGHRDTSDHIGSWREAIADWSWWYLSDMLDAGSEFTLQLVPDFVDDVFLHGTVRGTAESIATDAGNWNNATVMDYVVDQGTQLFTDVNGNPTGSIESETHGWVAFVPGVGPVASWEEFVYTSVDCQSGCPEEGLVGVPLETVSLSLSQLPLANENSSWGALKASW